VPPQFILKPIVPKGPLTKANKGAVVAAMRNWAANSVSDLSRYPPTRSTYRRTGRLGRSWTFSGPAAKGKDLVVEVGNNVEYAPFVEGLETQDPRQLALFKAYGWPSAEAVAKKHWKTAVPAIQAALT